MLPIFPDFKLLELNDKVDIEKHYHKPIISSDYHFASLWGWDLNNDIRISSLNGNLVVKFKDYQTNKSLYSFYGKNKLEKTIETLLSFLKENGDKASISLLPESNFNSSEIVKLSQKFMITEDEGNFDYIFNVKDLLKYNSQKLYSKRKQLKKFIENYIDQTKVITLETLSPNHQKDILELLKKWSSGKLTKNDVNTIEVEALKRSLFLMPNIKFFVLCIYISDKLKGFSIYEIIDKNHSIHSFQKADLSFVGITEFINQKVAENLDKLGIRFINAEQDLGIEGLRRAKRAYNPTFLKKYTITKKSAN